MDKTEATEQELKDHAERLRKRADRALCELRAALVGEPDSAEVTAAGDVELHWGTTIVFWQGPGSVDWPALYLPQAPEPDESDAPAGVCGVCGSTAVHVQLVAGVYTCRDCVHDLRGNDPWPMGRTA